jgi:hypothetical protein
MLTRLNLETRAQHPEADVLWLELLAREPTLADYEAALVMTYGF